MQRRTFFHGSGWVWWVILVAVFFTALRLTALHTSGERPAATDSAPKEDQVFFQELVAYHLVQPGPAGTQLLEMVPADAVHGFKLRQRTETDPEVKERLERQCTLVKQLYRSQIGRAVRKAIPGPGTRPIALLLSGTIGPWTAPAPGIHGKLGTPTIRNCGAGLPDRSRNSALLSRQAVWKAASTVGFKPLKLRETWRFIPAYP
ncbi:MAG: hypothetical protein JRD04_05395 [Deltaproteobacteria bacterium]|nr:hypothetical protein [Deltaproteobacteria bacterium]